MRERLRFEHEIELLTSRPPPAQARERETAEGLAKKLNFLSFLPHWVEQGGKDIPLAPRVLDPKIYDGPDKYRLAQTRGLVQSLQECLMSVMRKSEFGHIKVALVDLTKGIAKPEFAGFNHTEQVFAASVPKIVPMLAAFQLRHDLRVANKQKKPKTLAELFAAVRDDWAKTQQDPRGRATPFTRGVPLRGKLVLVNNAPVFLSAPKAPRLEKGVCVSTARWMRTSSGSLQLDGNDVCESHRNLKIG